MNCFTIRSARSRRISSQSTVVVLEEVEPLANASPPIEPVANDFPPAVPDENAPMNLP